jgi:hypothetical protein
MEPRRYAELLLLAALALPLSAAAQGRPTYCCTADGKTHCGDILPKACYGKAYREISAQGRIRHIAAPLTAEERARAEEAERAQKAEEARILAQRRQDQALLTTYTGVGDIDARRDRAVAEVERTLVDVRKRIEALEKEHAALGKERAALGGAEVPRELGDKLHNVEAELRTQRGIVDAKNREMETIRTRFNDDRRRYLELTQGNAPAR